MINFAVYLVEWDKEAEKYVVKTFPSRRVYDSEAVAQSVADEWNKENDGLQERKQVLVNVNGNKVPFEKLPCNTCKDRYSLHCPTCEWNKKGKVNTY